MHIETPCHYFLQWDNVLHPGGSCNMTSAGMVLATFGKPGPKMGYARLPDNLMAWCEARGLDRHELAVIDQVLETFGLKDKSSYTTSIADLKKHVKAGKLAIVHGDFTPSGHIMVVDGLDEEKGLWRCNDPAGKWNNGYHDTSSGEGVWYGSEWFTKCIAPDGVVWAHLIDK